MAVLGAPHSTQNLGTEAEFEGEGKLAVTEGGGERTGGVEVEDVEVDVLVYSEYNEQQKHMRNTLFTHTN